MVRAVVEAVERAGVRRDRLLAAAGLDCRQLDDCNARLSLGQYDRVQRAALELSGDEALGLHMGEHVSSAAFDLLGHLAEHAATLRVGIETIARYSRILSEGPFAALIEEGETASVRYAFKRDASPSIRLLAELAMSGTLRLIRQFAGPSAHPRRVCFEHDAPAYVTEYERIFAGAQRFGQAFTGIDFERSWLERTQLYKNPELYTVLQTQAERALGRLAREARVSELVMEHLGSHDLAQVPSMDEVARHFEMSARSLRRRLLTEGVVYKDLVERALATRAKRMLEAPRASIQETAYAMGFATPAAFHRAFKRWTGMTPKEYRASY